MRTYVVEQGDTLSGIAARGGFDAREVWNDGQNEDIRARRSDPEVLAPGDIMYVPEPTERRLNLTARTTNRYRATLPTRTLQLTLTHGGEETLANEPYEVHGLATPMSGQSDGEGRVTLQVPIFAREVDLRFPRLGTRSILLVGHLDPAEHETGARTRLAALGYLPPHDLFPPDLRREPAPVERERDLRSALRAFQKDQGLQESGGLDQATAGALTDAHGR